MVRIKNILEKPRFKKLREVVPIIKDHYSYLLNMSPECAILDLTQAENCVRVAGDAFKPQTPDELSSIDCSWWLDYYVKTKSDGTFQMWVKQYRQKFFDLADRHQKVREALEYYLRKNPT